MSTLTCETPSVSSICLPHRWHISWVVVDFLSISFLINSLLFFGNHYDANAEVHTLSALVHPKWKLAVICSAEVSHTLLIDSFRFHSNFPSLCQSHHSAARANVCTYFGGVYSSYPAGIHLKTATQWPAQSSCGLCTQPGKRPQASVPSWLTW